MPKERVILLQILTLYSDMTLRERTSQYLSVSILKQLCYFLGHGQLTDIKSYLVTLGREKLTNLGLVLGLQFATMRDLPTDFLNHMITLWLDKADDVLSKGEPSWRSLIQGLRSQQVRQNGIANNIAKDHCIQSEGMCCLTVVYVMSSNIATLLGLHEVVKKTFAYLDICRAP